MARDSWLVTRDLWLVTNKNSMYWSQSEYKISVTSETKNISVFAKAATRQGSQKIWNWTQNGLVFRKNSRPCIKIYLKICVNKTSACREPQGRTTSLVESWNLGQRKTMEEIERWNEILGNIMNLMLSQIVKQTQCRAACCIQHSEKQSRSYSFCVVYIALRNSNKQSRC